MMAKSLHKVRYTLQVQQCQQKNERIDTDRRPAYYYSVCSSRLQLGVWNFYQLTSLRTLQSNLLPAQPSEAQLVKSEKKRFCALTDLLVQKAAQSCRGSYGLIGVSPSPVTKCWLYPCSTIIPGNSHLF